MNQRTTVEMPLNFIGQIVKRFNHLTSRFKEKPSVEIDEYVLEHFLLYHGLVGSSPENQKDFRDIRADIFQAVKNRSSLEMGIALKLQPLWWEDKLKAIIAEIKDSDREALVHCLLPEDPDSMLAPNQNPLLSDDWRVRANAAMLLAFIQARESSERMSQALHDTTGTTRAAFCHIAFALAELKTDVARKALENFVFDEEPWFRVDALGALARWPSSAVDRSIMEGMVASNPFLDYAAVAIAKQHHPSVFLNSSSKNVQDGGCAMVAALMDASVQTFSFEAIAPLKIHELLDRLAVLAREETSGIRLTALLSLIDWTREHRDQLDDDELPDEQKLQELKSEFRSSKIESTIRKRVREHKFSRSPEKPLRDLEGLKLIELIGEFKLTSELKVLHQFLYIESSYLNAAVDALGKMGDPGTAQLLIALSRHLADAEKRSLSPPSSQPVLEDDQEKSQTYWRVLRALGAIPSAESAALLFLATQDHAPDKRQQAIESLVSLKQITNLPEEETGRLQTVISRALHDPSAQVKLAGLQGAAAVGERALIPEVLALIDAREVSLSRQAFKTLTQLSGRGMRHDVLEALKKKMAAAPDSQRRRRLSDFIDKV